MRFLIDAQISPALARWLAERGHTAEHVKGLDLESAEDPEIWAYAVRVGAIIITKDQDFANRRAFGRSGPPIVWIRVGNCMRHHLLTLFSTIYQPLLTSLEEGETLIEVV